MKKNLRIVSAAAAALLTVAPVAATTVTTAFADTINGGTDHTSAANTDISVALTVTNADALTSNDTASNVKWNLSSSIGNWPANVATKVKLYKVTTNESGNEVDTLDTDGSLEAGNSYRLKIIATDDVKLSGLDHSKTYNLNGDNWGSDQNVDANGVSLTGVTVESNIFTVKDTKPGNPIVTNVPADDTAAATLQTKATINAKTVEGKSNYNVNEVAHQIATGDTNGAGPAYKFTRTDPTENGSNFSEAQLEDSIISTFKDALKTAGVTVDSKGNFDAPAAPVLVNVKHTLANGNSITFPVTVQFATVDKSVNSPVFMYQGTALTDNNLTTAVEQSIEKTDWYYTPVGNSVNKQAIANAFTAVVKRGTAGDGTGDDGNATIIPINADDVDVSKVNTKVAGKYPVSITVTNPAGIKTTLAFQIAVGERGATYKQVKVGAGLTIPVYTINGNVVTANTGDGSTVADGTQVAIFDDTFNNPVDVLGVKYSRINKSGSNQYIETKYIDGSYVPAATVTKRVMHASYVYDKDHKRVGTKRIASFTNIQVTGDAVKLNDGTLAYAIGDNQYVVATNIDGTKLTLKRNAYIYKTSKKHSKKSLKKGTTVTVYGDPFTFKDGKKYYRIGEGKQYIKVANF